MATTSTHLTLEQYAALPDEPYKQELLNGEVYESHPEPWYQMWSQEVGRALMKMLPATEFEVCFQFGMKFPNMQYATVLQPDLSVFRRGDLPNPNEVKESYIALHPLLVCEALYPDQNTEFLRKKIDVYRAWGISWIWSLDFENRKVLVEGPTGKRWQEYEIYLESPLPPLRLDLIKLFSQMDAA